MNFFPSLVGFEASKIISFVFLYKNIYGKKSPIEKVWEAKQPLFLTGEISPNCIIKKLKIKINRFWRFSKSQKK
jgi:hypothetical protein